MEFLLLGYITDSFGLDGTVKVLSKTQFGEYRYQKGNVVYLYSEKLDLRLEAKVISYRHSGLFDFIKLDIINTKEEAEAYKHYEVQVEKNLNDLQEDEFFFDDLKGCQVIDLNSNVLGKVSVVEEFPAQITLRVKKPNGKEFFVPFIETFVKNVDIKTKTIQIEVIEGML